MESCPLAHHAFGADAPAVAVDDPLYGRQPDARACKFLVRMQALEGAEKLVRVGHVESRPVVADKESSRAIFAYCTEFDTRAFTFCGKLPGVAQEVIENDPQESRITLNVQAISDLKLSTSVGLSSLKVRGHRARDVAEIHSSFRHLASTDARECQQIVDQLGHPFRGGSHPL